MAGFAKKDFARAAGFYEKEFIRKNFTKAARISQKSFYGAGLRPHPIKGIYPLFLLKTTNKHNQAKEFSSHL